MLNVLRCGLFYKKPSNDARSVLLCSIVWHLPAEIPGPSRPVVISSRKLPGCVGLVEETLSEPNTNRLMHICRQEASAVDDDGPELDTILFGASGHWQLATREYMDGADGRILTRENEVMVYASPCPFDGLSGAWLEMEKRHPVLPGPGSTGLTLSTWRNASAWQVQLSTTGVILEAGVIAPALGILIGMWWASPAFSGDRSR
ncbi:hypothetical protein GE09DRAFT_1123829 [Coniochaeta sp. 2T2.1]|nr:hypothetical protein GE09DRAFT_1123829 [Coniochaeta sp. 2T2.1]